MANSSHFKHRYIGAIIIKNIVLPKLDFCGFWLTILKINKISFLIFPIYKSAIKIYIKKFPSK